MTWVRITLACTVFVALLAARDATAGAPTEQLRSQVDKVLKLLDDGGLKAPDKASLGRHWAARTPEEREEFVKLFGDLLERSYISKIELYGGEKIQYVGDKIEGDTALVQSKLLR